MFKRTTTFPMNATDVPCSQGTHHLQKIYYTLRENMNQEVQISFTASREILINELGFNYDKISFLMRYALPECLCYYMLIWKGWDDRSCSFRQFRRHLRFKIGFMFAHQERFCKPAKSADDLTENEADKSPYALTIYSAPVDCPSSVPRPNTVDDSAAATHWMPLTVQEFINFDNVRVAVELPFLKFDRGNLHERKRYAPGFSPSNIGFVDVARPKRTRSHTIDSLIAYFDRLVYAVKAFNAIHKPRNDVTIASELEMVCEELVADLRAVGEDIAVPCTVNFNIGRSFYVRSWRAKRPDPESEHSELTDYAEVIIPKVALALSAVDSFADLEVKLSPKRTERYANLLNNSITYGCLACSLNFKGEDGFRNVTKHFRLKHKGEPPVVCYMCEERFEVYKLLETRWGHCCPVEVMEIEG